MNKRLIFLGMVLVNFFATFSFVSAAGRSEVKIPVMGEPFSVVQDYDASPFTPFALHDAYITHTPSGLDTPAEKRKQGVCLLPFLLKSFLR